MSVVNGYRFGGAMMDAAVAALPRDAQQAVRVHWPRVIAASPDKGAALGDAAGETLGLVRRGILDRQVGVDLICEWANNHGLGEDAARQAIERAEKIEWQTPARSARGADWRARLIDVMQLCDERFPELGYVVPEIIPEGMTLLASRPKMGKSWLLLQIGGAVASGVSALVHSDSPAHGDVLYLALEDNPRRLQRRLTKHFGARKECWPERLTAAIEWRRLDQGGIEDMRAWCRLVEAPRLIMIDTLKRVRPPKQRSQSDYDADYEANQGLQQLAGDMRLSIIVAHHDRKMEADNVFDTVSGTLGLTGGVDAIALLKRSQGGVTLHVEGRDLPETIERAMNFDRETCRWTVLGSAAEQSRSSERSRVLAALEDAPKGLSVGAIIEAAKLKNRNAADLLLSRMYEVGDVQRLARGVYGLRRPLTDETDRQIGD